MKTTLLVTLLFAGAPLYACDTFDTAATTASKSPGDAQPSKDPRRKGESKDGNRTPPRDLPVLPPYLFM